MIEKREKTGSKLEPETAGWNDRIEPLSLVTPLQNLICKFEGSNSFKKEPVNSIFRHMDLILQKSALRSKFKGKDTF